MGTLFVVSTPIGNLEDITVRAIKTLFAVEFIACEDTSHTGLLLSELKKRYQSFLLQNSGVTAQQFIRYDDRMEEHRIPEILDLLHKDKSVALVSDAGTPLVSDPGFRLVRECIKRGMKVESVPGPSAMLTALTSSGLPTDKFLFLGYPPEKKSNRIKLFENLLQINRLIYNTYIFYCAPHKLETTLKDLKEVVGDKNITICRELTKVHEECWTGKISEAINHFKQSKGEFALLFRL